LDVDGDGCLTFEELAHAMHLPDLKLPSKAIIKGGQFKKPIRRPPSITLSPAMEKPLRE